MNWIYQGKEFTEIPSGSYGFIYQITYTDGRKYIGQKQFYSYNTKPALQSGVLRENAFRIQKRVKLTKEELANRTKQQVRMNVKSKLANFDVVSSESKWQKYTGSSKLTKGLEVAKKEILYLVPTKRNMTYMECKALFIHEALESDEYLNENILGKFYKDNLI